MTAMLFDRPSSAGPPLESLIHAATLAPSPDNNQPWRFELREGRLFVFADPDRGLPSDAEGMFCLLALGAAIENICVAARALGYEPTVQCFAQRPPVDTETCQGPVAAVSFAAAAGLQDPLVDQLAARRTCRRPFERGPIEPEKLARLSAAAAPLGEDRPGGVPPGELRLDWIERPADLKRLSRLVAAGDRIRFEYRPFHAELYRQLRFRAADAERTRDGLDVRTLELPPGGAWLLRGLRSWAALAALNQLGFSRLLTLSSAQLVRRSGAVGVLSIAADGPAATTAAYLSAGRAFERLWLTAQSEGLALHPLGSLPIFLRQHAQRTALRRHGPLLEKISRQFAVLAPEANRRVTVMLFRLGYSRPTRVRSLRRPAEAVLKA